MGAFLTFFQYVLPPIWVVVGWAADGKGFPGRNPQRGTKQKGYWSNGKGFMGGHLSKNSGRPKHVTALTSLSSLQCTHDHQLPYSGHLKLTMMSLPECCKIIQAFQITHRAIFLREHKVLVEDVEVVLPYHIRFQSGLPSLHTRPSPSGWTDAVLLLAI